MSRTIEDVLNEMVPSESETLNDAMRRTATYILELENESVTKNFHAHSRHEASVAAMQGLLARAQDLRDASADEWAAEAVHYADALLRALAEGEKP